jgi:GNAT superfamily N-acetyltransferase
VLQVAGMMDLPLDRKLAVDIDVDLPVEDRPWNIGLITGASGAGKSLTARELWPDSFMNHTWAPDLALVDNFPESSGAREITGLLSAVGLGSVPAWVKPYSVLSMGESFRADMARLLAETPEGSVAVVDEFTSTVDRQVAKVASHALQKTIRKAGRQLVAVTCHFDVIDWLQPDWVLEMPLGQFSWRRLQPHPPVELDVFPVERDEWARYKDHHYLSARIANGATCFAAYVEGRPVAFTSYLNFPHPHTKTIRMGHRLVVLPDWQGLGIAGRLCDWLGQHLYDQKLRLHYVVAHPAMIAMLARSPRWRDLGSTSRTLASAPTTHKGMMRRKMDPRSLGTRSFEYTAPLPS